jgi:NAD dependent epimerase/dehydratase family enzyme
MKILMTGATGWLGRSLGMDLVKRGHRIVALVRDPQKAAMHCPFPAQWVRWDYAQGQEVDGGLLQNVDAIVHLMGEPVAGTRWTEAVKDEISRSRVLSTKHLAALAQKHAIAHLV